MFGGIQIEVRSICQVGSCLVKSYPSEKFFDTIMEEDEEINGRLILTTRLPVGVVQTVLGLQVGYLDS